MEEVLQLQAEEVEAAEYRCLIDSSSSVRFSCIDCA
jgi:hypothetical protein